MLHWKSCPDEFQVQGTTCGLMPGPSSVALTLPAAASAAPSDALIGVVEEEETVSTNFTGIVDPDFATVFGGGEMNPPKP